MAWAKHEANFGEFDPKVIKTEREIAMLLKGFALLLLAGLGLAPGFALAAPPEQVPPRMDDSFIPGEFRGAGGGLSCVTAEKPDPATHPYIKCLHIGPLAIGQTRAALEKVLGPPYRVIPGRNGLRHSLYKPAATAGQQAVFFVSYKLENIIALQLSGTGSHPQFTLSSIKLGDPAKWVQKVLDGPFSTLPIEKRDGSKAMLWDYAPWPLSFEIKDDKVISMRISEPGS